MTYLEQLESWVSGNPQHDYIHNQCCPDFSCCRPDLLAPIEVRELFLAAYKSDNERVIIRMCMEFLSRAFEEQSIYIAGLDSSRLEIE